MKLAISGGPKTRNKPFPNYPIIGDEEKKSVLKVLDSGRLSTFIAAPGQYFLGGEKIKEFEGLFNSYHNTEYAIAFNSATAALHAAVVACGVQPGEEVITTSYTFTSTATSILMNNSIPVFADIDYSFNINPDEIRKKISNLTKAIIVVHLFGHPCDMDPIMKIAKEFNLKVIEDCAQSPGSMYKGRYVGTIGDCGIFSFTENKNITSGEGGMLITNNPEIADISRLVRNHGEAIISGQSRSYNSTILGWNYRMTEVDAAIGIEQFKKMDSFLNHERIKLCEYLNKNLKIDGLKTPENYNKNVYYLYPILYDKNKIGIKREVFIKALNAEGIPFGAGYIKPLYFSSIYHNNKPFIYKYYKGFSSYEPGLCPVAEDCHFNSLIATQVARPTATFEDMDDIINAIEKIITNKDELL